MARLVALCSLLAVCFAAASAPMLAHAQPSEADLTLAKQYFVLGKTYYQQANYEQALEAFQQSYKHSDKAALLYNIGKCHEALGQLEPAIDSYERYLKEEGKTDSTVQARIRNLKARLARRAKREQQAREREDRTKAVVAPPPPVKARRPKPEPAVKPPQPAPTVEPPPTKPPTVAKRPGLSEEGRSPAWMKWTGWSLIGVGAATIATSFILASRAKAKSDLLEEAYACPESNNPDCPSPAGSAYDWADVKDEIEGKGQTFEAAQIATLVIGIVAAGGGLTLLLLAPRLAQRHHARLSPMLGPDIVGVGGGFAFE